MFIGLEYLDLFSFPILFPENIHLFAPRAPFLTFRCGCGAREGGGGLFFCFGCPLCKAFALVLRSFLPPLFFDTRVAN